MNQDMSSWDISSATTIESMFASAASFAQDLCAWRERLATTATITMAFADSACESPSDPMVSVGPFCNVCDSPTVLPSEAAITTAPTDAPTPEPRCFGSSSELSQAVDDYMTNPSDAVLLDSYGPIGSWCVGSVTNFFALFDVDRNPMAATFNEDISGCKLICLGVGTRRRRRAEKLSLMTVLFGFFIFIGDTSSARDMYAMFSGAREFNQPIGAWDVSRVTDFGYMFANCTAFNSDISLWSVSSARTMDAMFDGATSFNQAIGDWDVSSVGFFSFMFYSADDFNADISQWSVGSGHVFDLMFAFATKFSSDLSAWDSKYGIESVGPAIEDFVLTIWLASASQATSMRGMFGEASSFFADLSRWDVSRVTDMRLMFLGALNFNSDLSSWSVGNATNVESMFLEAFSFSQNLCPWGSRLGSETLVETMFLNTNCPVTSVPVLTAEPPGPFCFAC